MFNPQFRAALRRFCIIQFEMALLRRLGFCLEMMKIHSVLQISLFETFSKRGRRYATMYIKSDVDLDLTLVRSAQAFQWYFDDRVHGVVKLLKECAQKYREKVDEQLFPDNALNYSAIVLYEVPLTHFAFPPYYSIKLGISHIRLKCNMLFFTSTFVLFCVMCEI